MAMAAEGSGGERPTIKIPQSLVDQAIRTLQSGMEGAFIAGDPRLACAITVIDNVRYGGFVVSPTPGPQFVRETPPTEQVQAAMAQAKKSLEDQLLYVPGTGGSAVVDFNHYNYFQRVPTAEEVFGVAPPPYDNGGYPGPTPEEDAAEAKKVADTIIRQPSWVPREIGETRHLKFDTIAIRIMRLVGAGATGTYRIEVDGPKNGWGKSEVSVNGRTCSYYPYWASELGLMLEILTLLEKMARALYADA